MQGLQCGVDPEGINRDIYDLSDNNLWYEEVEPEEEEEESEDEQEEELNLLPAGHLVS